MSGIATAVAVTSAYGAKKSADAQRGAADQAAAIQREQAAIARKDLAPYRRFGAEQLGELQNWLATPQGQFQAPTMEDVQAGQGYASRLGAIESSAAARGSLFSGNALRNIGEFGASEYDREYGRRQGEYQNELARRMSLANIGQSAAAGSAGISQGLGQNLAGLAMQGGQAQAQGYQGIGSAIGGGLGAYQGQQQWNDFLNRAYPKAGQ